MLVLDTSAIVALADARDHWHESVVDVLAEARGPRLAPTGILAEVTYMLNKRAGRGSVMLFLESVRDGAVTSEWDSADLERALALMERYSDLPLDFADACVIACAERRGIPVLSADRRDFSIVAREGTFTLMDLA